MSHICLLNLNNYIHSFETRFSNVFCIPKRNTMQFRIDTSSSLIFDSTTLWNKFHFELLNKETNLTKSKIKTSLKEIS